MKNDVKEFNKAVKKAKKKLERQQKDEFIPYRASLKLMCEKHARPEYVAPIRNRILREIEECEILGDYAYFNPKDWDDIFLDYIGLMAFGDILEGYFDKEYLIDFSRWLKSLNKEEEHYFRFAKAVKVAEISQLEDLKQAFERYNENNNTNTMDRSIVIVENELERRKKRGFKLLHK